MPNPQSRSADPAAREMLIRAGELGAKTVWDRHDDLKPLCGFGELGLCCADAHLIVARNLARAVACGAAAHSDHGREVVEVFRGAAEGGSASGYAISNPEKLLALAAEWGVPSANRAERQVAADLAARMAAQFGLQDGPLIPLSRAPAEQRRRWQKMGIVPRGIDREIVELLHRTHHGVESLRWPMAGAAP